MSINIKNLTKEEQATYLVIGKKIEPSMTEDTVLAFLFSTLEKRMTVPYEFIADFVFSTSEENSTEDNEWLNHNIKLLSESYAGSFSDVFAKNLEKINRHYNLAQVQKKYILQNIKASSLELDKHIGLLETKTGDIQSKIKDSQELIDKIDDTKSSLYTDFIAILGVFSSFVFVMFGGFSALSEILGSLGKKNISLGKIFVMSSFLMSMIFTIIYSLLLWVSNIINKPITKQVCDCRTHSCQNFWHTIQRHRFYCIVTLAMFLMFLVGFLMLVYHVEL